MSRTVLMPQALTRHKSHRKREMPRMTAPQERHWMVDDLRLWGLVWGASHGTPVLALHGWMDHADSFRVVAPRLRGCHVVALDLSGQGHSAHRAAHATYNIWDDLPQIVGVMDQLGWRDCVLLGHSRGANIAALLSAALPERARALIALDSLVPEPSDATVPATLRAFLQQTRDQVSRGARSFSGRGAYIDRRVRQGNARSTAETLADRAILETSEGVFLRGDPRLFASSAIRLNRAQIHDVLGAIRCPVLNVWGNRGILQSRPALAMLVDEAQRLVTDYTRIEMDGDHHLHLDPETAEKIAVAMGEFLEKRNLT